MYEQRSDTDLNKIIKDINTNIISKFKNYIICDRSLLLLYESTPANSNQELVLYKIVVPKSLREKCIRIHHITHYGIEKTYKNIKKKYFWKGLYSDIVNYVKSCTRCLTNKPQRIPTAPLQNTIIPYRPGQFISLDFVGPFNNGYSIKTAIDHFSKHLRLYPLRNINAMNAVQAMFEYIVTFGHPKMILSDNGKQFQAHIFKEFLFHKVLGIFLQNTTVAHPEANSVSERINFSVHAAVQTLMQDGYNFSTTVKVHETIYNCTYHNTIKTFPNKFHFGRNLSNIFETFNADKYLNRLDVHQDFFELMHNLQDLYDKVYSNLINYQKLQNSRQHTKTKLCHP